jgi:hypothetical protein
MRVPVAAKMALALFWIGNPLFSITTDHSHNLEKDSRFHLPDKKDNKEAIDEAISEGL